MVTFTECFNITFSFCCEQKGRGGGSGFSFSALRIQRGAEWSRRPCGAGGDHVASDENVVSNSPAQNPGEINFSALQNPTEILELLGFVDSGTWEQRCDHRLQVENCAGVACCHHSLFHSLHSGAVVAGMVAAAAGPWRCLLLESLCPTTSVACSGFGVECYNGIFRKSGGRGKQLNRFYVIFQSCCI